MRLQNDGDIQRVLSVYALPIYRLAYARTRSRSDAEDICQEVFLELVSRNPTFPTENARRAWLIRVTVNKSNSLWRTLWRRRRATKRRRWRTRWLRCPRTTGCSSTCSIMRD